MELAGWLAYTTVTHAVWPVCHYVGSRAYGATYRRVSNRLRDESTMTLDNAKTYVVARGRATHVDPRYKYVVHEGQVELADDPVNNNQLLERDWVVILGPSDIDVPRPCGGHPSNQRMNSGRGDDDTEDMVHDEDNERDTETEDEDIDDYMADDTTSDDDHNVSRVRRGAMQASA